MSSQPCSECGDDLASYSRVSALAVAAYDWMWTLPIEFEIYYEQTSIFHLSRACVLFILIRYSSIAVLICGNIGYFKSNWTMVECKRYIYVAPVLKSVQMTVAATILFIRTWAISRRSVRVFWSLLIFLIIISILELWSSVYKREPTRSDGLNCISGNPRGEHFSWIFYLLALSFDAACLGTSAFHLYYQSPSGTTLHGLSGRLLKEGMLYFAVLAAVNLVNLVVYLESSAKTQSVAASWGNALTWIMAQRILIQLHKIRRASSQMLGPLGEHSHGHRHGYGRGLKFGSHPHGQSGTTGGSSWGNTGDLPLSGVHIAVQVEQHRSPPWPGLARTDSGSDSKSGMRAPSPDAADRVDMGQAPLDEQKSRKRRPSIAFQETDHETSLCSTV